MKVVAFNGSPKANGNTYQALELVVNELKKENIEVEIIHVGNKEIRGCLSCYMCRKNGDNKCVIKDDYVNNWIEKVNEADGVILGSPVHFASLGATMKAFLDRAFFAGGSVFRGKVGASVVAVRRSGGVPTFNQLNNYLNHEEMVMPSSNYWNVIHGTLPGEIHKDEEGVQLMRILGKNMVRSLKLVEEGKNSIKEIEKEPKIVTSFIR